MSDKICKALAVASIHCGRAITAVMLALVAAITLCGASPANCQEGNEVASDVRKNTGATYYRISSPVHRELTVTVDCDGVRTIVTMAGGTVEDALEQAGVELDELDSVDHPLFMRVSDGDRITVTRMDMLAVTREIQVPYKKVEIPTSLLAPGKERVLVEGQEGLKLESYEQLVINGKKQEKEYIDEEILVKPVTEKVLVGRSAHPVSELDFGYELDENGDPVDYADVLRGQRAAGYSARAGAKTASGREAVVGHVAVDPKVIPYGSRLYIKSTDGKFVYGYAIAADTGTAIRDGIIAVDLFYGSYMESALNGIKNVDIFILE